MSSQNSPTHDYLKTQVMTASPEQLQLMLYDGAIRFAEQARAAMLAKDFEQTHNFLLRAQNIVLELLNGLRPEYNQPPCERLGSLYNFIYRRLVDANLKKDPTCIDDALKILRYQRETWVLLMEKLAAERSQTSDPLTGPPTDGEQPRLSVQG